MKSYKKSTFFDIKSTFFFKLLITLFQLCIFSSPVGNQIDRRTEDEMLKEDAIMLVVTSAMARYASENTVSERHRFIKRLQLLLIFS